MNKTNENLRLWHHNLIRWHILTMIRFLFNEHFVLLVSLHEFSQSFNIFTLDIEFISKYQYTLCKASIYSYGV